MAGLTFGAALGQLILRKRKALGLTQTQLAEDAFNTSGKTRRVSELENGQVANPHPKTIDPIIVTLGITDAELEDCARISERIPDPQLDQAYREAERLIKKIAQKFEHSNPNASTDELEAFLKEKAAEWSRLRDRIKSLESVETDISDIKTSAEAALSEGKFEDVDRLLAEAEEMQQQLSTILEIRKQSEIRLARGDNSLFQGNFDQASNHYLAAADFFRPFDEHEMINVLIETAGRIYETSRRSLDKAYVISTYVLETALKTRYSRNDTNVQGDLSYKIGLIYRSSLEVSEEKDFYNILNKGIKFSRAAIAIFCSLNDTYYTASAQIALGNCFLDKGKKEKTLDSIQSSIDMFEEARQTLGDLHPQLAAHACNNLGSALAARHFYAGQARTEASEQEILSAYSNAIVASEKCGELEVWGVAKANIGGSLSEKARISSCTPEMAKFFRINAISCFLAAIETFPSVLFPYRFADAHIGLANTLFEHALTQEQQDLAEFYFLRAIGSYEQACEFFDKDKYPKRWAQSQVQIAKIFAIHAEASSKDVRTSDLERAAVCLQEALDVLRVNDLREESNQCEKILEKVRQQQSSS